MPQRHYILPLQYSGDLDVTWQRQWRMLALRQNGRLIGLVPDLRKLSQKQKSFQLSDGSILSIEVFYTGSILFDFSLLLNNKLLVCREKAVRSLMIACGTILVVAGFNSLAGLLSLSDQLANHLNGGTVSLFLLCAGQFSFSFREAATAFIISAIYLILGWLAWRRSWIAIAISIGLVCLDSAYLVLILIRGSGELAVFVPLVLLSRLIILLAMTTGLAGLEKLQGGNLAASHLASSGTFRMKQQVKQIIVTVLALLIDPISWIFNKMNENNR